MFHKPVYYKHSVTVEVLAWITSPFSMFSDVLLEFFVDILVENDNGDCV